MAELAKAKGVETNIIPPEDPACAAHLSRLGVPAFFAGDWASSQPRDSNFTVRRVGWPPEHEAEKIVELLAPRIGLPSGVFPQMVSGLDEIIDNALTHAESPIDCIVAGQAFPETGKVEVAILDFGQTIKGHLTKNPKHIAVTNHCDAIRLALQDGITGTPDGKRNIRGGQNSGAGLTYVKDYCEAGGGELTVLSGSAWITCLPDGEAVTGRIKGLPFQGCLVNIRFFTDRGLLKPKIEPIL